MTWEMRVLRHLMSRIYHKLFPANYDCFCFDNDLYMLMADECRDNVTIM